MIVSEIGSADGSTRVLICAAVLTEEASGMSMLDLGPVGALDGGIGVVAR